MRIVSATGSLDLDVILSGFVCCCFVLIIVESNDTLFFFVLYSFVVECIGFFVVLGLGLGDLNGDVTFSFLFVRDDKVGLVGRDRCGDCDCFIVTFDLQLLYDLKRNTIVHLWYN